jgi:hypothetical protein
MTYYHIKYIFHVKNPTFCDGKISPGYGFAWIRIGVWLAPWIRIRIEVKSWIRIRIEINADPKQLKKL